MFEALNEFIAIVADAAPWLLPFVVLLVWWGFTNWQVLNSPEKKESFAWAITQLKENNWGKRYLHSLGWLLDRVGIWIGDREKLDQIYITPNNPKNFILKTFGFNPFTPESYDKCLRMAFIYPVLAFLITWVSGGNGKIGAEALMGEASRSLIVEHRWWLILIITIMELFIMRWLFSWKTRWQWLIPSITITLITIGLFIAKLDDYEGSEYVILYLKLTLVALFLCAIFFILMFLSSLCTGFLISYSFQKAYKTAFSNAINLLITVSIAFILTVVTCIGVFIAALFFVSTEYSTEWENLPSLSIAIAAMISAVFTLAFSSISVDIGAFFIIIAFVFLNANYHSYYSIPSDYLFFSFIAIVGSGITMTAFELLWQRLICRNNMKWFWIAYTSIFLGSGYLSLIYIDKTSYLLPLLLCLLLPIVNAPLDWISLGVTRGLLQAVRAGHHGGWSALGFGLLDLLLALIFLFLIAAVLVGATALGNVVAGKTLVDLEAVFSGLRADPWNINHWWVYFMMLSTLVPTLVHFSLAGGAMTLWLPQKLREQIADNIEQNHYKISAAWVYLTFTPAVGFVIAPVLLMLLLYWLVTTNGGWLGGHLLDWAEWLAFTINPTTGTQP